MFRIFLQRKKASRCELLTLLFISAAHCDAYHAMWTRLFVKVFLSIREDTDVYGVTVSPAEST